MLLDDHPRLLPTPEEAWTGVQRGWQPRRTACELLPLGAACGRVTAQALRSPPDLPPFDRSVTDGYAVRSADLASESTRRPLRVAGEVRTGQPAAQRLASGEAIWVATGSMLPPGADAVVKVERTQTVQEHVTVYGPVRPGDCVVRRADLVLISGGSSVGLKDLTAAALTTLPDTRLLVEGVAAKPGRPTIVATVGLAASWLSPRGRQPDRRERR
jgi:molybdopterin molybdotransferase